MSLKPLNEQKQKSSQEQKQREKEWRTVLLCLELLVIQVLVVI